MSLKNFLITGGTGFIGLRLSRRLLERGELAGPDGKPRPIDEIVLFDWRAHKVSCAELLGNQMTLVPDVGQNE